MLAAQIQGDGSLEVALVDVPAAERGRGTGSTLYLQVLAEAERRSVPLYSTGMLSSDARRIHDRLRSVHGLQFEPVGPLTRLLVGRTHSAR